MKSLLPAAVVCAAGVFTGCVVVDSQAHIAREEKRFDVSGTPELTLTTFDGAIELRAGDARTVVVEIEKRGPTKEGLDGLRVETSQDGNHITVEVKRPAHEVVFFGIGATPTAKLIVTMPREGNVTARSGDGAINVDGIHGRLELHTGDGSITFHADGGTRMTDDWSFTTGDGSVAIDLPRDFAAELDAHTGDGTIRNELTVAAEAGDDNKRSEDERRSLRTRLGAGGKTLKIRTGDGSIKLRSS
jgi:hypothetical protein